MQKALIITVDGDKIETDIEGNSYEVLQKAVGGRFEHVQLNPELSLWCNEDGIFESLKVNPTACQLWDAVFGIGTGVILGDVILTGGADDEGNTLGLSDKMLALIEKLTPEFQKW